MNILILNWRDVTHPKSGGAEVVTMQHAKAWSHMGNTVTWLTAGYSGAKNEEVFQNIRFIRRFGSLTIYLYVPFFLLFKSKKFDVIIDEVHGFPFFSPLFTRKPVVVFIHEIAGEIWDYMFPFPKNIIGKLLEQWYFQLYKHCFFWTDAPSTVKELEERGIPKKQCVAIPCPITVDEKIFVLHSSFLDGNQEPGTKNKKPTYLFVSRVVRMKGIEEVIKAFSFIARAQKDAMLWIIGGGEGSYVEELRQMVDEYGIKNSVLFLGNVSEKEKYDRMAHAHVLLHASVKEGWGLVVLEAAMVGTPSVVYNVPGLKDVVIHNKTGIVIENNSPQEMARAAVMLINDPKRYSRYQKNGMERVKKINWNDVTLQSFNLLIKAMK